MKSHKFWALRMKHSKVQREMALLIFLWFVECLFSDIEEHLGTTISQIGPDMHVEADEFAGKVVYGEKLKQSKPLYNNHVAQLAPAVRDLAQLETMAQSSFLSLMYKGKSGLQTAALWLHYCQIKPIIVCIKFKCSILKWRLIGICFLKIHCWNWVFVLPKKPFMKQKEGDYALWC